MKFGRVSVKLSQWSKDKLQEIGETIAIGAILIGVPALLVFGGFVLRNIIGR